MTGEHYKDGIGCKTYYRRCPSALARLSGGDSVAAWLCRSRSRHGTRATRSINGDRMRGIAAVILALTLVAGLPGIPAHGQDHCAKLTSLLPGYSDGDSSITVTSEGARTLCGARGTLF